MNHNVAAAARRNLRSLAIAVVVPTAILLSFLPVRIWASERLFEEGSLYANLSVDELSEYLRAQKNRMQADLSSEESVVQDAPTDTAQAPFLNVPLPWGASASVSARVEPVDLDRLQLLASGASKKSRQHEKHVGVDGAVRLGDAGALRIGYDVRQWQDQEAVKMSTTADAGLEYNLNERTVLAAGYNVDREPTGTTATTNVDVGYAVTKSTLLRAGYKLVNFSDAGSREYKAKVAKANLTVRF